jgi:hypothetical protein
MANGTFKNRAMLFARSVFSGSCLPHQNNIALLYFHLIILGLIQPLIVVINSYADVLFSIILTNHKIVQELFYVAWLYVIG